MKVESWLELNPREKLLAGLFIILTVLSSVVSFLYLEMRQLEKAQKIELAECYKRIELAKLSERNAQVDCGREKLLIVEKLLAEQKLANEKQLEVNERQNEIIYRNKNFVDDTKTVVNKLNKVIQKKK